MKGWVQHHTTYNAFGRHLADRFGSEFAEVESEWPEFGLSTFAEVEPAAVAPQ